MYHLISLTGKVKNKEISRKKIKTGYKSKSIRTMLLIHIQ